MSPYLKAHVLVACNIPKKKKSIVIILSSVL